MGILMREIIERTLAPIFSLFIIMLGISFFNTFISIRIAEEGWNNLMTGGLYSAYYAGMMIGALYIEKMIVRTGHIRGFSIFAAATALSILLQSFALSPYTWLFYRFLTGLGCAGLFVVIESWLLILSSSKTRGVILSIYMVALYLGQALGQFIINTVSIGALTAFNLAVIFSIFSIIPVSLMRASAPSLTESERVPLFYLFRKVPLGFLGNLLSGLILSSFYALGPVFAKDSGFSIWEISLVMSTVIFGGMAFQWPIGIFSDLVERKKVIILASFILMVISLILYWFTIMPFYLLLIFLFLYGGFSFTLYPISITYCCDFFSRAGITSVTCAALIIYGMGCIIGPLISPVLMEYTKPSGLFLYAAILSFLLILYALITYKTLPKELPDTHEPYQNIPTTSPKASKLDPRALDDTE